MATMEIFAWLLIGHAIADYPMQSEWVARAKQPGFTFDGEAIWPSVLACHAGIHAGAVKLVTGSWLLAGLEFVAHAGIDYSRGRGLLSYNGDQAAHVGCKVLDGACLRRRPGVQLARAAASRRPMARLGALVATQDFRSRHA